MGDEAVGVATAASRAAASAVVGAGDMTGTNYSPVIVVLSCY